MKQPLAIVACCVALTGCSLTFTIGTQGDGGGGGRVDGGDGGGSGAVPCGPTICTGGSVCCDSSCGLCGVDWCDPQGCNQDSGTSPGCGLTPAPCNAVTYPPALVADVGDAGAIFRGTVAQLNFTSPDLGSTQTPANQVAITVLEAFPSSAFIGEFVNMQVVVILPAPPTFQVGYTGYFFGNDAVLGQMVNLSSVDVVDPSAFPSLDTEIPAIQQALADQKLYERLSQAQSIVLGQVTASQDLTPTCVGSEHSATWGDGTVATSCLLAGVPTGPSPSIGFLSSTDIAWFAYPKLDAGEQGLFVVQSTANPPGGASCEPSPIPYQGAVTDPLDVQPRSAAQHVLDVLNCPPNL